MFCLFYFRVMPKKAAYSRLFDRAGKKGQGEKPNAGAARFSPYPAQSDKAA
jgi:hypothetical protein